MPPKSAVRALPAAPPLISLLSSAEILRESDNRWEAGVAYETEVCSDTGTGIFAACDASNADADPGTTITSLEPLVIWAGDSCSPGGAAARDWQGRAKRKLGACESHIIERELWRGDVARAQTGWTNPYLTDDSAVIVTPATTDPIPALACLEQALADCNCGVQGMIHATRQVVTHWAAANLLFRDGNKLRTHLGTIVVPGSGYDGSGPGAGSPDPAADNSIWAYATSMVHVRLGPTTVLPGELAQAMDRVTNTATYWAQRIVVVGFDCCHFAAEIDTIALCDNIGS